MSMKNVFFMKIFHEEITIYDGTTIANTEDPVFEWQIDEPPTG
jgi:hypothetical protein